MAYYRRRILKVVIQVDMSQFVSEIEKAKIALGKMR